MPDTFQEYFGYTFDNPSEEIAVSRNICPIALPTGDIYLFYTDRMGASNVFDVKVFSADDPAGKTAYLFDEVDMKAFPLGSRVLFGGLVNNNLSEDTPQMKWVGYVSDTSSTPNKIRPIIEAYNPSVQYDKNTNMLHLFYWCNMNVDGKGVPVPEGKTPNNWYDYTIENIVVYRGMNTGFSTPTGSSTDMKVVKVLYHAQGYFKKVCNLNGAIKNLEVLDSNGAVITNQKTIDNKSNQAYYIPIFNQPKPVNIPKKVSNKYVADIVLDVANSSVSTEREFEIDSYVVATDEQGYATDVTITFRNIWYQRKVTLVNYTTPSKLSVNFPYTVEEYDITAKIDTVNGDIVINPPANSTNEQANADIKRGYYTKWLYRVKIEYIGGSFYVLRDYRGCEINAIG